MKFGGNGEDGVSRNEQWDLGDLYLPCLDFIVRVWFSEFYCVWIKTIRSFLKVGLQLIEMKDWAMDTKMDQNLF